MQTSTQVYRNLKAAEFSEPQAKTLVEILQAAGIVEPEPPESELARIEQYLLAEPFQPFMIEMAVTESSISNSADSPGMVRFTCAISMESAGRSSVQIISCEFRRYNNFGCAVC
jgi:hypothetical protein